MKTIHELFEFARKHRAYLESSITIASRASAHFYADCAELAEDNEPGDTCNGTIGTQKLIEFMLKYINDFILEDSEIQYVPICKSKWVSTEKSMERSLDTLREINFNIAERKARLKERE